MTLTLALPEQYGLVLAVATSTFFINTLHMMRTSKMRKLSGIKYPISYATTEQAAKDPAAYTFNCAQRAHANFTENHTPLLGALLIAGLRNPFAAAVLGATWSVGRVIYLYGYTSGAGPQGRTVGSALGFLADAILKVMAAYTSYTLITGQ